MKHKKPIIIGTAVLAVLVAWATLSVPKTANADEAKAAPPAESPKTDVPKATDKADKPAEAKAGEAAPKPEANELPSRATEVKAVRAEAKPAAAEMGRASNDPRQRRRQQQAEAAAAKAAEEDASSES